MAQMWPVFPQCQQTCGPPPKMALNAMLSLSCLHIISFFHCSPSHAPGCHNEHPPEVINILHNQTWPRELTNDMYANSMVSAGIWSSLVTGTPISFSQKVIHSVYWTNPDWHNFCALDQSQEFPSQHKLHCQTTHMVNLVQIPQRMSGLWVWICASYNSPTLKIISTQVSAIFFWACFSPHCVTIYTNHSIKEALQYTCNEATPLDMFLVHHFLGLGLSIIHPRANHLSPWYIICLVQGYFSYISGPYAYPWYPPRANHLSPWYIICLVQGCLSYIPGPFAHMFLVHHFSIKYIPGLHRIHSRVNHISPWYIVVLVQGCIQYIPGSTTYHPGTLLSWSKAVYNTFQGQPHITLVHHLFGPGLCHIHPWTIPIHAPFLAQGCLSYPWTIRMHSPGTSLSCSRAI